MLEEKLEQARQKKTGHYLKLFVGVVVLGFFLGVLLIGISSVDFSKKKEQPVVTNTSFPPAPKNNDKDRDMFTKALAQYENDFEMYFAQRGIESWNETAFLEMQDMKQAALLAFSAGNYSQATQQIKLLQEKAALTLEEGKRRFNEHFQKAVSSLGNDQYDEALFHIDQALLTAPQSSEAASVKVQIEQLPTLLPLLYEVDVARSENNLQKEHDALNKLLQLSPEREKLAERLKEVTKALTDRQFEQQIAAGFTAVQRGDVKNAKDHFQKAKSISAGREELSILMGEITALEQTIFINTALARAQSEVRRDDWQSARVNFNKVLAKAPGNPIAQDGLKKADQILQLQKNFSQFFSAPYRLADLNVQGTAIKTLASATKASQYSYSIKKQANQLELLLKKLSRDIPVFITSDSKTHILVRGVGKVGTVAQKEIQLRPGRYTFEGTRDGYKSKLLQVLIPYDNDTFSLFITCDEPI